MALLQLYFSGHSTPELHRTVFEHPLSARRVESVRGKSEGAYSRSGSFQWSPAVRALCVLLIKAKEAAVSQREQAPILQTNARGAISALDYALGRSAQWIIDFFGSDSAGRPIARRVLTRTNPERKRPGPLAITLNEKFLRPHQIEIIWDEKPVSSAESLAELDRLLVEAGEWELGRTSFGASRSERPLCSIHELRPSFVREARLMLRATNIFSTRALREALRGLEETQALHSVQKEIRTELEDLDLSLIGAERLGLAVRADELGRLFSSDAPIRFGVTPSQIGTLALLRFLRDVRKLPIEIDCSFTHTSDLARGIANGGGKQFPECCVMTTASFSLLPSKLRREYRPLMVMPAATHTIVGQTATNPNDALRETAEYHFLHDFPTTPAFWFDALAKTGAVSLDRSRIIHADPDETLAALRANDRSIRAILWFPYNVIAACVAGTKTLLQAPAPGVGLGFVQNMLFVHQSFANSKLRKQLLDILIRDAWLSLLQSEELCTQVVHAQLEDPGYRQSLWRYSGLYRLEGDLAA